jgi:hypothetical protein
MQVTNDASTNLRGAPRWWWCRRLFGLAVLALVAGIAAAGSGGGAARADAVQHVWVHYDYMIGPNGESYAPDAAGIQIVVDSFRRHGVILHVDPQHTAIPLHDVIVFDAPGNPFYSFDPACTGPDAVGFSALKAQYFHPASDHPWHYVIFGKYVQVDSFANLLNCWANHDFPGFAYQVGNAGYAELPGYDFVVTAGHPGRGTDHHLVDYNCLGVLVPRRLLRRDTPTTRRTQPRRNGGHRADTASDRLHLLVLPVPGLRTRGWADRLEHQRHRN